MKCLAGIQGGEFFLGVYYHMEETMKCGSWMAVSRVKAIFLSVFSILIIKNLHTAAFTVFGIEFC